jgi:hypothetical protein
MNHKIHNAMIGTHVAKPQPQVDNLPPMARSNCQQQHRCRFIVSKIFHRQYYR